MRLSLNRGDDNALLRVFRPMCSCTESGGDDNTLPSGSEGTCASYRKGGDDNTLLPVRTANVRFSPNRFVTIILCNPGERRLRLSPNRGDDNTLLRVLQPMRCGTESGCDDNTLQSGRAVPKTCCSPNRGRGQCAIGSGKDLEGVARWLLTRVLSENKRTRRTSTSLSSTGTAPTSRTPSVKSNTGAHLHRLSCSVSLFVSHG